MIKKYLIVFFLIFIFCIINGPLNVSAEVSSAVPEQINARILPLVWYSVLSINDEDSIKIYARIQNNSGIDFTGIATFYVDDKVILDSAFTSSDDSLNDVSAKWVAEVGSHDIQVKIVTSLPSDKTLISYESVKSNISVAEKVIQESIKDTAINTISNIVSKIDETIVPLVNKIKDLKKPVNIIEDITNQDTGVYDASQKNDGVVLGASSDITSNDIESKSDSNTNKADSIYNKGIDILAFSIKHWLWTLGGIILLFLIIKIKRRRKE